MRIVQLDDSHSPKYKLSFGIVNESHKDQIILKDFYGLEGEIIRDYWRSRVKNKRIIWRNFNENDDSISQSVMCYW